MLLQIIEIMLLILRLGEREEVLLEKYIDKNEQVEQEWGQIDLLLEKKVELLLVQEIQQTLHFL